jgi:hypothetical protein
VNNQALQQLIHLRRLHLEDAGLITDVGMMRLSSLTALHIANVRGITDATLRQLAPTLIKVKLVRCHSITDTGVAALFNVRRLRLNTRKITINAVKNLHCLSVLEIGPLSEITQEECCALSSGAWTSSGITWDALGSHLSMYKITCFPEHTQTHDWLSKYLLSDRARLRILWLPTAMQEKVFAKMECLLAEHKEASNDTENYTLHETYLLECDPKLSEDVTRFAKTLAYFY